MADGFSIYPIARIRTDFPEKFGVPRQSGLVASLRALVVFEPEFRVPEAFRGLERYSHLWLIWQFSEVKREGWSPTVRPPRIGGNTRVGVFATRSPFRPNSLGLSSVGLEEVRLGGPDGPTLVVSGADLMDGTPIFDIKPYLPYTDCHPEASQGLGTPGGEGLLEVDFPASLLERVPEDLRQPLLDVLAQDPRPGYQRIPDREYWMAFGGMEVGFSVEGETLRVTGLREGGPRKG